MIFKLHGSKVGGKEMPPKFVFVKMQKVFMLEMVVPNVNEPPRLVDPQHLQMKLSLGAIVLNRN